MNPRIYDLFELKGNMDVELLLDMHCSNWKHYTRVICQIFRFRGRWSEFDNSFSQFVSRIGSGKSNHTVVWWFHNVVTKLISENVRIIDGKAFLVSAIDFNFGIQSRLVDKLNVETSTRHFVTAFEFNFEMSMIYVENTCANMPSSYMGEQSVNNIGFNV